MITTQRHIHSVGHLGAGSEYREPDPYLPCIRLSKQIGRTHLFSSRFFDITFHRGKSKAERFEVLNLSASVGLQGPRIAEPSVVMLSERRQRRYKQATRIANDTASVGDGK